MKQWAVQDAKARFSELLETCLREGPQIVTKRGTDAAVLVPVKEWARLKSAGRLTLKDLLLAEAPRGAMTGKPRGKSRRRRPVDPA
jgi:prevent-host-death family protein